MAKERAKAAVKAAKEGKGKKRTAELVEDDGAQVSKIRGEGAGSDGSNEGGEVEEPERKKAKRNRREKPKKTNDGGKAKRISKNPKE